MRHQRLLQRALPSLNRRPHTSAAVVPKDCAASATVAADVQFALLCRPFNCCCPSPWLLPAGTRPEKIRIQKWYTGAHGNSRGAARMRADRQCRLGCCPASAMRACMPVQWILGGRLQQLQAQAGTKG